VCIAALGVGNPGFAASAETAASMLEVTKNVLHESCLGWEMSGASMEIARELGPRPDRAFGLHRATSSHYGVLLTMHRVMEEVRVGSGHLGDRRGNWHRIGILFWDMSARSGAHVTVLGRPGFEPVGADGAVSTVGANFVQVELDDEISKGIEHIRASFLGASEEVLARRGIVDGYGTVVLLGALVRSNSS